MGLENLKSIFSLEDNGNSVVNDTPLTDLNSNLNDTTPFANTNVINFNSDYDNLNTNIYSNTNTYLTTNNEGLQNTSWSSLYNSDGTAKSDVGEIMYPNVSRDNLDKRYQSSTNPFGMRKSMLSSGNEPYEWSNIGHDEPLSGLGLSSDRRFPIMRALKDVSRIGKYLTSTDGILNFIGGQNLLGLMSQVEYYENDELKQAKQRFQAQYNPLSTLTAVGSRFAGIGLPNYLIERDPDFGIGLFDRPNKYTDVVSDTIQKRFSSEDPTDDDSLTGMFTNFWNQAIGSGVVKGRRGSDPHTLMPFGGYKDGGLDLTYHDSLNDAYNISDVNKIVDKDYGMPFYFKDLRDGAFIILRGYLEAITENVSPSWSTQNFLGRSEPVYIYERAERDVSFSLKLFAHTENELHAIYKKINRLTSLCYPEYKHDQHLLTQVGGGGNTPATNDFSVTPSETQYDTSLLRMKPPFVKMRLGELYGTTDNEILGFFRSITYSVPEESPWETKAGKRVPKYVTAAITFQVINTELPSLDFARSTGIGGKSESGHTEYKNNINHFYGLVREMGAD